MENKKKKKYGIKKSLTEEYKETKKVPLLVYFILRGLVILCMILQMIRGDINNALLCLLALGLLLVPYTIQRRLNISLPNTLEIIIYLFIFASAILGEINNFYGIIPYWDKMLHTLNGFLCAAIGFGTVDLLNKSKAKIRLSAKYLCLVAFCFSMTIGVLWEFYEYSADKIILSDMQKDTIVSTISTVELEPDKNNKSVVIKNIDKTILYDKDGNIIGTIDSGYLDIGLNDTMEDLIVNFVGASIFCVLSYIYLSSGKKRQQNFINNFVPTKVKNVKNNKKIKV